MEKITWSLSFRQASSPHEYFWSLFVLKLLSDEQSYSCQSCPKWPLQFQTVLSEVMPEVSTSLLANKARRNRLTLGQV